MSAKKNQQPEVEIELDRPRVLRIGFNGLAAYERERGHGWDQTIQRMLQPGGQQQAVMEIRALLWAALLDDDPVLTLLDAGNLIDHAAGDSMAEKLASIFFLLLELWSGLKPEKHREGLKKAIEMAKAGSTSVKADA